MKKKTTRLNLRLTEEQLERLTKAAELLDTSASDFIRRAFEKEIDRVAKSHPELARNAA